MAVAAAAAATWFGLVYLSCDTEDATISEEKKLTVALFVAVVGSSKVSLLDLLFWLAGCHTTLFQH